MDQKQIIIKRKALEILDENDGFIIKDFPISNRYYNVKPFLVGEENHVAKFYLDDYINSMVVSCTSKTEIGIRNKLEYILEQQQIYGLSYWKVQDDNGEVVGITGLTCDEGEYEITFIFNRTGLCIPIVNSLYDIVFNKLEITKIVAYNLSYNTPSHTICKNLGMLPDNYVMKDNYIKDDYLTRFFETKDMFNSNQTNNNRIKYSSRLNKPTELHPNARRLNDYIKNVKNDLKLDYLNSLSSVIKSKFPKKVAEEIFGLI